MPRNCERISSSRRMINMIKMPCSSPACAERKLSVLCAVHATSAQQHSEARSLPIPCIQQNRRAVLSLVASGALISLVPGANAGVLQDYVERSQRPVMTPQQALVKLLDARGILYELQELAKTDPKSDERFRARSLLPGMAKSLRTVGMAAPVLVAEVMGGNAKATVSKEYGGSGTDPAAAKATPVYNAIGQIITISGRTIKKEAQASPQYAENAIQKINELLAMLPQQEVDAAQEIRKARKQPTLVKRTDVPTNAV